MSSVHCRGSGSTSFPSPIFSGIQRYRESHWVRGSATDDSYPTLGAMVRRGEFGVAGMSMEQMFDFGLDRILDGIEAYSERRG